LNPWPPIEEEAEFQRLLRYLALSSRFLLALVHAETPRAASALLGALPSRLAERRGEPVRLVVLDPYRPGSTAPLSAQAALEGILFRLADAPSEDRARGVILVMDGSRFLEEDAPAWENLFARMNEQRNSLIQGLSCELLLVGPARLLDLFALRSPDFWSIRSSEFCEDLPHQRLPSVALERFLEARRACPCPPDAPLTWVYRSFASMAAPEPEEFVLTSSIRAPWKKLAAAIRQVHQGELQVASAPLMDVLLELEDLPKNPGFFPTVAYLHASHLARLYGAQVMFHIQGPRAALALLRGSMEDLPFSVAPGHFSDFCTLQAGQIRRLYLDAMGIQDAFDFCQRLAEAATGEAQQTQVLAGASEEAATWNQLDELLEDRGASLRSTLDARLERAGSGAPEQLSHLASLRMALPRRVAEQTLHIDAVTLTSWLNMALLEQVEEVEIRVPERLRPLLPGLPPEKETPFRLAIAEALPADWKMEEGKWQGSPEQAHFLARICAEKGAVHGDRDKAALVVAIEWLRSQQRRGEIRELSEVVKRAGLETRLAMVLSVAWSNADVVRAKAYLAIAEASLDASDPMTTVAFLVHKGDVLRQQGHLQEALAAWEKTLEVLNQTPGIPEEQRVFSLAVVWGRIADVRQTQGKLDEALSIRQEKELPIYMHLGDVKGEAMTWGQIAEIREMQGKLEEALVIMQEKELPVYVRLGYALEQAIAWGNISDIWRAQGKLDEALEVLQENALPIFKRLGAVQEEAVAWGKIADIWRMWKKLDEALEVLQEKVLPAFLRLGAVREEAVAWGKIADIREAQGKIDEALTIRQEQELPVHVRLGDVREEAVCRTNIAIALLRRGLSSDEPQAREHLLWAYEQTSRRGFAVASEIAALLETQGWLPPG
jgi:tetratricopeptide (TPR) repeat protein